MKNTLLSIVFIGILCCTAAVAFGQNSFYNDIDYTRINCNFNGSVSHGKVILVYGDGGIILRSPDGGMNWERINLTDSLNIIGMVSLGSDFVGLCSEKYAIISSDDGKNWQLKNLGDTIQCYQLFTNNDKLYALLNSKVWIMNKQFEKIKEYSLTTDAQYNSFTLVGNTLVCSAADGKLLKINTDNDQQQTVVLSSIVTASDYKITKPIKSNGSTLVYFNLANNLYQFDINSSTVKFILLLQTTNGSAFESNGENIYFLYRSSSAVKLDSLHFVRADKNTTKPIPIKQPGNDRYIVDLSFQNLTFLSKDTIVAVGKRNLIYMSTNGGTNWELKSYLGNYNIHLFDNQTGRAFGPFAQMFHTNNGGITWIPQKNYNPLFSDSKFISPENYSGTSFFKDKMNGFVGIELYLSNDSNIIYTNDGGETVQIQSNDIIRSDFETFTVEHSGKYILFTWGCIGWNLGCWTVVYKLNDTLGVEHKTAMRGIQMFYATNLNGTLYAVGQDSSDLDTAKYAIFRSEDAGTSWKKDFTFDVRLANRFELKANNISRIGNSLYLRWFSSVKQPDDTSARQNYYKIDLDTKTARKILTTKQDGGWEIHKVKNKYYVGLYTFAKGGIKTSMLTTDDMDKDSVEWKPFTSTRFEIPYFSNFISDTLFSFTANDTASNGYGLYFARAKKANTVREESTIEQTKQMYLSSPIPLPARDIVRMRLYWDKALSIDNAEFMVFDVLGTSVSRKGEFILNKQNSYSGELVWQSPKLPSGMYFIRCRIGDSYCSTPVLIE